MNRTRTPGLPWLALATKKCSQRALASRSLVEREGEQREGRPDAQIQGSAPAGRHEGEGRRKEALRALPHRAKGEAHLRRLQEKPEGKPAAEALKASRGPEAKQLTDPENCPRFLRPSTKNRPL